MRWLLALFLFPVLLLLLLGGALYLPPVQDLVRGKAVDLLREELGTEVALGAFNLRFPIGVSIHGLHIADQHGDTLIHAGELRASLSISGLFNRHIRLWGVSLSDTRVHLDQDADSTFNFQFILDAFAQDTVQAEDPNEGVGWRFTLDGVTLNKVHFSTTLRPAQLELDVRTGVLELPLTAFDLDSSRFHAGDVRIADTHIAMRHAPSEPEPDPYPILVSPFGDLDLDLSTITLDKVTFTMATIGSVDSLALGVVHARIEVEHIDTRQQRFDVDRVLVDGLQYTAVMDASAEAEMTPREPPWIAYNDGFRYFLRDLDVHLGQLVLNDAAFAMHRRTEAAPAGDPDADHIVLTGIHARITDIVATNDEVQLAVEDLRGQYGSPGHRIELKSDIRATAETLALTGMRARWEDLFAEGDLHVRQGSLERAYRSPEQVPMVLRLRSSLPRAEQARLIALLPPGTLPIATIPEGYVVNAHLAGCLARLDTIAVAITGDAGTRFVVDGWLSKATDPQHMAFDLRVDPFIMGTGTRALLEAYLPDRTWLPARLEVRSSLNGDPDGITTTVDIRSDLAEIAGTALVTGLRKGSPDVLTMDLKATAVDLGRILGDTTWQDADVRIQADARGLDTPQRKGFVEIRPTRLRRGDADLSVAYLRADFAGDSIQAIMDVEGEALQLRAQAAGSWPTEQEDVTVAMDIELGRADLQQLGVTHHDLVVIGHWQGALGVDTLGRTDFTLDMDSTRLMSGTELFVFEQLGLQASFSADSTRASVRSDALDLTFEANIGLDTLLDRTQQKARSIFTNDTAFRARPGERFDLRAELKRSEWLAGMIVPSLRSLEMEEFDAFYDGDADRANMRIAVPELRYDSLEVEGSMFDLNIVGSEMNASLTVDHVAQGGYFVDGLSVGISGSGGDLTGDLRIVQDDVERYHVGVSMQRDETGASFSFAPDLILDQRPWQVDPGNRLRITGTSIEATDLDLRSGEERLTLRTPGRTLEIGLQAFRIATLTNVVSATDSVPLLAGEVDGTIHLPASGAHGMMADVSVAGLAIRGRELGTLDVDVIGEALERYRGTALLSHTSNALDATFDLGPESQRVRASFDLRDISALQPFVSEYLYELSGGADGVVDHRMTADRTSLNGRVHFEQAAVGVVATGATYTLADEVLTLTDQGLRLDAFELRDSLGNVFRVDGDVRTVTGDKPTLDLRLRTDRFQLVSSTIEQNDQFFGDLFARLDLGIRGPATRPSVKGELGVLPGTVFSVVLPGTTVELVNAEGIVVFTDDLYAVDTLALDPDAAVLRDSLEALLPGVELDLAIKVDKEAVFAIVLDPAAGDQATVSGAADLVFRYAPNAPMYLSGPFVVERGEYTLDLYGLVKKRFELVKGGSVRWSGDPVKADMDLRARYRSDTAPYALVASGNTMMDAERNRLQQPLPFDVLIDIGGDMNQPDITFGIDLERQVRNSFPKVSEQLDRLNQPGNSEELNRQVFGLLVLNSFLVDEGSGGDPSSGIATSAARNSVNGLLTDQMNKLTGRYLKGVDVSLGVNTYDQSSGQSTYQRTSLDYRVSKRLLNDRLSFEVGGSVGVDEQNAQVSNVSNTRSAQYAILYDLTADGRFRIRGFHENAFDLYDGEITNSGVAIMFTQDIEENERARARSRALILEERERKASEQQQDPARGPGTR
ncbi:MAG: translocation/assembly module TamB domain-containing protein [Flavobacteriales bacterium]